MSSIGTRSRLTFAVCILYTVCSPHNNVIDVKRHYFWHHPPVSRQALGAGDDGDGDGDGNDDGDWWWKNLDRGTDGCHALRCSDMQSNRG